MGSGQSSLSYRSAFVELTNKTQPIDANNDEFWDQFWCDGPTRISDMFASVPGSEIRTLREESPGNLATLCYKSVERLTQIAEASFPTTQDQQTAVNCVRLLTRIIPYLYEDPEWRPFFWSVLPAQSESNSETTNNIPLAQTLVSSLCDLLFCPDFTVHSLSKPGPENAEDMHTIDSCEYIWEAGVGFARSPPPNAQHDANRTEIIRLLLVCFSETMYLTQSEARTEVNRWIAFFAGPKNRHVLPLFTSLLNVVCAYNPGASSLPYNHLMFTDSREPLVELALQILCVTLEADTHDLDATEKGRLNSTASGDSGSNLFLNYMSRIHRDEDFSFILEGITRLLNNPLTQTYLPGSAKKVEMHQELLILFWRICDINKKFLYYVLKSSRVLDVLVPILYHLIGARNDKSQLGLMHIGVFIILLLSGERNFGVRLNKPYTNRTALDIAVFTGNHADLLIIVFHKIITTGHQCLQPLFDCLITIIDNVSPYVKSLSMISASKLLHLTEAFSQPWFLYSAPNNYQLVLFLLEVFNNMIQYQFDGNSCLVYSIIRKRQVFYHLANLPSTDEDIREILAKFGGLRKRFVAPPDTEDEEEDENEEVYQEEVDDSQSTALATLEDTLEPKESKKVISPECIPQTASFDSSKEPTEEKPGGENEGDIAEVQSETCKEKEPKIESKTGVPTETTAPAMAMNLQTSLAGTPSLANMTTDSAPMGSSADAEEYVSGNDLHSHEGPSSPVHAAPSTFSDVSGDRQLEATFAVDVLTSDTVEQPSASDILVDVTIDDIFLETELHRSYFTKSQVFRIRRLLGEEIFSSSNKKSDEVTADSRIEAAKASKTHRGRRMAASPSASTVAWRPTAKWVASWREKLPLQTIMRMLQVLVPQVEKICIEKSLKDEPQILKFLQNGTLVGLLPVPHPILIRKYQSNVGTMIWFRTYIWGVVYLRNSDPPIWFDTNVRLFEVQRS